MLNELSEFWDKGIVYNFIINSSISTTMCVDETRVINKIMYTVIYVIFAFNLFIY